MPTPCLHPPPPPRRHTGLTLIGALEGYYYFFVVFCLNLCRRKWKCRFFAQRTENQSFEQQVHFWSMNYMVCRIFANENKGLR